MEFPPVAFMSYVRHDDGQDDGKLTAIRQKLEGELRTQTGQPFQIFQDTHDK